MAGGDKKGGGVQVTTFHASLHIGLCHAGEGLEVLRVDYGEKAMWSGSNTTGGTMSINRPDLHGGYEREGGVIGQMQLLMGGAGQVLSDFLKSKLNQDTSLVPSFRGIFSIFFTGSGNEGFYWASSNPYLKDIHVRVRRPSVGLNPARALIPILPDSQGRSQRASNPAHVIYECWTNKEWGEGVDPSEIDIDAMEACALQLQIEQFGVAFKYVRQSTIEAVVQEVANHISAAIFDDPETGLRTMKLLRDDYDPSSLYEITPDNADLSNFQRKAWGELANEIVLTYTNPENETEASVTVQDLAGIASQGGIKSSGRNFYMIRDPRTATMVAERELAASVYPIASCVATVDSTAWKVKPGDVVKVTWPEHGLNQGFFRVSEVGYTPPGDPRVQLRLVEDIFSLDTTEFVEPDGTFWVNTSSAPQDLTNVAIFTTPAFFAYQALGLNSPGDLAYPDAVAAVFAERPDPDFMSFDLYGPATDAAGNTIDRRFGSKDFARVNTVAVPLVAESDTVINRDDLDDLTSPIEGFGPGDFLFIQPDNEAQSEICYVTSRDATNVYLARGLFDTTPKDWPAGTQIWAMRSGGEALVDWTRRSDTESVTYQLAPRTSQGVLDLALATGRGVTLTDRAHLPLRPANVQVNGVGFGVVDATGGGDLDVTWAFRNRTSEASQFVRWDAANVVPEAGLTATVTVLDAADRSFVTSYTGLTGNAHTVPLADLTGLSSVIIQVSAELDGDTSLQAHEITVSL